MGKGSLRDRMVVAVSNLLLRSVATSQFRYKLTLVIEHGMREAEAGNVPGLRKVRQDDNQ